MGQMNVLVTEVLFPVSKCTAAALVGSFGKLIVTFV